MFKGISKVRLLLPLNFKGISKILKIKPLTFEENSLKIKGFQRIHNLRLVKIEFEEKQT